MGWPEGEVRVGLTRRAGWDGGRNLSGWPSVRLLSVFLAAVGVVEVKLRAVMAR
jgi:hypothetical protein